MSKNSNAKLTLKRLTPDAKVNLSAVGSAIGLLISYYAKLPIEESLAVTIIVTYALGYFAPRKDYHSHDVDLSEE